MSLAGADKKAAEPSGRSSRGAAGLLHKAEGGLWLTPLTLIACSSRED